MIYKNTVDVLYRQGNRVFDMDYWVRENINPRNWSRTNGGLDGIKYSFESEQDAVIFALRWA